ncbi:unnamed protein product, partial [Tilletia controversa]
DVKFKPGVGPKRPGRKTTLGGPGGWKRPRHDPQREFLAAADRDEPAEYTPGQPHRDPKRSKANLAGSGH